MNLKEEKDKLIDAIKNLETNIDWLLNSKISSSDNEEKILQLKIELEQKDNQINNQQIKINDTRKQLDQAITDIEKVLSYKEE